MASTGKREGEPTGTLSSDNKKLKAAADSHPQAPILYLNDGGERVNLPKSLLEKFDESSPLCCMLKDVWSPLNPMDEENRTYLNRDPAAFRDLLSYLRYGSVFLQEIADSKLRIHRLEVEADYFLVPEVRSELIQLGLCQEPVTFQSDQWVSFAATGTRQRWNWEYHGGNQNMLTAVGSKEKSVPWGMEVQESGIYLVFFRLATVAGETPPPGSGYVEKCHDEFAKLCRFTLKANNHDAEPHDNWTHTILRCGVFDPRDKEDRQVSENEDGGSYFLQYTASAAEVVSLRKGDILYIEHGEVRIPNKYGMQISTLVESHEGIHPNSLNRVTLVKVQGNTLARYDRIINDKTPQHPTVATWEKSDTDFPPTTFDPKLVKGGTMIESSNNHSANHLVLGRIASSFKPGDGWVESESQSVRLQVETRGGRPLQVSSCICYKLLFNDWDHDTDTVDYGSLNDLVFLENNSRISVGNNGSKESYLASHGALPVAFGKLPTQNLFLLMLSSDLRVDRYRLDTETSHSLSFARATGDQVLEPLFHIFENSNDDSALEASPSSFTDDPTPCIVIGNVPATGGDCRCSLFLNEDQLAVSKIPNERVEGGSSRLKYFFHEVLEIKKGDRISIRNQADQNSFDFERFYGHLAIIMMNRPGMTAT